MNKFRIQEILAGDVEQISGSAMKTVRGAGDHAVSQRHIAAFLIELMCDPLD